MIIQKANEKWHLMQMIYASLLFADFKAGTLL